MPPRTEPPSPAELALLYGWNEATHVVAQVALTWSEDLLAQVDLTRLTPADRHLLIGCVVSGMATVLASHAETSPRTELHRAALMWALRTANETTLDLALRASGDDDEPPEKLP